MRLVMNTGTKAIEPRNTDQHHGKHEHEAELRFVDTFVALGQEDTDPIVEGSRDDLADNGKDERGERDEPDFGD